MRKTLSVFVAMFLLFSLCIFGVVAEETEPQEITLSLTSGNCTGSYTGPLVNDLPHGVGRFESKNSDGTEWYYQGDFVDGHFCGQGVLEFASGERKVGTFERDMLNGQGKLYKNDELVYEGGWFDDQFSGQGTAYNGNERWVGEFANGTLNGTATHYVDGTMRASGTWKNGQLWKGTLYDENGEWLEDVNQEGNPLGVQIFLWVFIVVIVVFFFGAPIFIMVSANKRRKAQEQLARDQWTAALEQVKAAQEEERKKQLAWTCPACGGANYDCDVCEFCGTGRYAK